MTVPIAAPTVIDRDRPLRVHVVGNSAAVLVEPAHGPRDGGTYGEQLGPMLGAEGVPTVVSHSGRWFGRVNDVLGDYEAAIRDAFPDVLVLNFGIIECQSDALPTWLVRHLGTWHRTSRPGAGLYREGIAPPLWRALRRYQRWAGQHDRVTHRLRPRRFVQDLRRIIDLARKDCGCLVLLMDIDPPGDRIEHWLPGTRNRARVYNDLLRSVADSYDDTVRFVTSSASLTDIDAQLPDGLHRTPEGHALAARMLANEIHCWLGRTPS